MSNSSGIPSELESTRSYHTPVATKGATAYHMPVVTKVATVWSAGSASTKMLASQMLSVIYENMVYLTSRGSRDLKHAKYKVT